MNEWNDFFVAIGGASAALTGLIFVGVSINLTRILSFPTLPNRALQTLILLLIILIVSILFLIPHQPLMLIGIEVSAIGFIAVITMLWMDHYNYKNVDAPYKNQILAYSIFSQFCVLPYLISGITLLCCGENGVYWVVPAVICSFLKSVIDAWVLLVEINR
jgi:modulator of FtsH protease